jgi:hypothetical protein
MSNESKTETFAFDEKAQALNSFRAGMQKFLERLESQPETVDAVIFTIIGNDGTGFGATGALMGSPVHLAQLHESLEEHPELHLGKMQLAAVRMVETAIEKLSTPSGPEVKH